MVNYLALISAIRWKKWSPKAMRRGRGRKRRKGDSLEIPLDLQMEILTRLPAKSLMGFKCVSKIWSCLIRSRYFTNRYHTVASRRPPRLYMSLVEQLGCASMEVCHSPGKSELISFSSSSSDSGESFSPDLTVPGMGGCNMVVLRGLILYKVCQRACIYNPATRQSVTLPAVKSNIFAQEDSRKYVFYFLGHDPVLDRYKVVCNVVLKSPRITSEHWVFVLEGGGSWKKTEFDQPHVPTRTGLCIDGVIYYLASTSTSRCIVFSFDVRSEEFNMIQVPPSVSDFGEYVGFIEYGGKPTIFDHTHLVQTGLVDLWVVEDGGKWSKKSLVLQPSQMHIFDGINHLAVQCTTTQNGEVILAPSPMPSSGYFLYYDLQKNDLRKVHVSGICDRGFGETHIYFTFMNKSESIVHLET